MTINELCTKAHDAAMAKGWYERDRELPELLMLIVSELSEALEADRKSQWCPVVIANQYDPLDKETFEKRIKDTVEDEIADAFIRLADLCGFYGIDIESHIKAKMMYNETRPRKHGKEY